MNSKSIQFPKRDFLVSKEVLYQSQWYGNKLFEVDASDEGEKYMVAFPYPYMNGYLHMGHAFSISKPEFQIGFQRLKGKKALFPFGFHCTGMPIKAAADKIQREIEMFGKNFDGFSKEEEILDSKVDCKVKKHSKATTKSTGLTYQFQILASSGVPLDEIHKFSDPKYWIEFFPPEATLDLKRLGLHVDWRRSFVTTDLNPFYDSFIRWQFNKLKTVSPSKILFGERFTIYSQVDGQACMDHDRSSGEGVGVQEYTGIKLKVLLPVTGVLNSPVFQKDLGTRTLYLVAATLRPETMYGQTNCFVGVDLSYGVFIANDNEAWVCTDRAAKNMAWQGLFSHGKGVVKKILDLKGIDLVGVPLTAPLSKFDKIYTLPMEGVLANKGTGVVTSVPSDSPDDYITMMDLKKKFSYYNILPEWVEPFLPPKPIISTPQFGDLCAVKAVEILKIQSQKDKELLSKAKEMVYKEGFYNGTIIVGNFAGKSVQEAKPLIRKLLIEEGLAFFYCEPEGLVVSRSGDECIVASMAQWYMDYGESSWKKKALDCLEKMELYHDETRNAFLGTLDWLNQWACSRSFGLGSRLPWDKEWLIESLSDSTIYMAYYTVAHILHEGTLDGSIPSKFDVKAEDMTDEVWNFVMLDGPLPSSSISESTLQLMKKEFNFFYPLDLRTSGKDLINNHLSFFIYNHTAIFPESKWPKGIRVNGHLKLNGEKMSKSTGNFLTLREALQKYGADAIRFSLADAGDSLDDANFEEKTADDAILKLYTEREWLMENLVVNYKSLRTGPMNWHDNVFDAEIDAIIQKCEGFYEKMQYREVLKVGFYELQNARNEYRKASTGQGLALKGDEIFVGMHIDLLKRFASIQSLLLSPITPHWSENIWIEILKKETSIMIASWPEHKLPDNILLESALYLKTLLSTIRSTEDSIAKRKTKKNKGITVPVVPSEITIYVAKEFPDWQEKVMKILQLHHNGKEFSGDIAALKDSGLIKDKRVMPFASQIKKRVDMEGVSAFNRDILFPEFEVLDINRDYIKRDLYALQITNVKIVDSSEAKNEIGEAAVPGSPTYSITPEKI